jgi:hypothetical protein
MTEELLRSAILRLRAQALEQYGIIKNIYNQPADAETVNKICQHTQLLAQLEGSMLTLQQYAEEIMSPTTATEVAPEVEEGEDSAESEASIGHEELMERSSSYRSSAERGEARLAQEAEEE